MKKLLKYAGILILVVIASALVLGLFVSRELKYEKSICIDAPIETVWEHVNSLADLDAWSPWNDLDPNMKKTMTGVDGTIGASQSWDSDVSEVGRGSQTISRIAEPTLFETHLKFDNWFGDGTTGYIHLSEQQDCVGVTWGIHSDVPYPFNAMLVFMDMEKAMDAEWNRGLGKLKTLCEQ
jgi:hypothetical protein